jgi:hypothetical protein
MKTTIWYAIFLFSLGAILLLLNETGNMHWLQKLPYITIAVAYFIGRFFGELGTGKPKRRGIKQ